MSEGTSINQPPPAGFLPKMAFEPSKVERGWVLMFNCLLWTHLSFLEPQNLTLNRKLQWNTWLCLDSASLFLRPSLVKIQALLLLAGHDQEFSTPGLSWTLVSHACQMSQVLGLHTYALEGHTIRIWWCLPPT
jgi:hypothetical protein